MKLFSELCICLFFSGIVIIILMLSLIPYNKFHETNF